MLTRFALLVRVVACGTPAGEDDPQPDGADGPDAAVGADATVLGPHQAPPYEGTDPTDRDDDAIADELEDYLVAQFAPAIRLAPSGVDWTRPASVGWYLARVHMRFDHPNCDDHEVLGLGEVTYSSIWMQTHATNSFCFHTGTTLRSGYDPDGYHAHKEFFLQPPDDAVHAGIPPDRKDEWRVYAHVKASGYPGAAFDVQIWMFYPYNDFYGGINHEADWEHATISVSADLSFVSAYYSAHNGGHRYDDPGELGWVARTHPVGYAADGSHAIYPTAGEHSTGVPGFPDHTYVGGPEWRTWENAVNLGERRNVIRPDQVWVHYAGRWGEVGNLDDTSGPTGPMYQGSWKIQGAEY